MEFKKRDLELPLERGRLLLPRLTPYSAMEIYRTLRDSPVNFRMIRSEHVKDQEDYFPHNQSQIQKSNFTTHPARSIPIASESLESFESFQLIDTLVVVTYISSHALNATQSEDYEKAVQALKEKLQFQAYRKGGTHLFSFQTHLTSLSLSTEFQVKAQATVAKSLKSN